MDGGRFSHRYQRRFFFLNGDALCYRTRPPEPMERPTHAARPHRGREERPRVIPLTSVCNVRMHSKAKCVLDLTPHVARRLSARSRRDLGEVH